MKIFLCLLSSFFFVMEINCSEKQRPALLIKINSDESSSGTDESSSDTDELSSDAIVKQPSVREWKNLSRVTPASDQAQASGTKYRIIPQAVVPVFEREENPLAGFNRALIGVSLVAFFFAGGKYVSDRAQEK